MLLCSLPIHTPVVSVFHSFIRSTDVDGGLFLCQAQCWALSNAVKQNISLSSGSLCPRRGRKKIHVSVGVKREIQGGLGEKMKEGGDRREVRDIPGEGSNREAV